MGKWVYPAERQRAPTNSFDRDARNRCAISARAVDAWGNNAAKRACS
jgi:hypothetical protein